MRLRTLAFFALLLAPASPGILAQTAPALFDPIPAFPFTQDDPLTLHQPALPNHPFTVTGRSGAILGMQDGTVELWQLPTKFFSALHLRAEVEGYPVPIDLNPLAAELEVAPDHTTLTYAHAAITVRQHMFVPAPNPDDPDNPQDPNAGLGGQILFEIHAIHPATLIVTLTPSLVQMWPAPQWGQPGWDWHPIGSGGVYTLGTDNPHLFGLIGMPGATPGPISPYQEHPRTLPLEFRVHFDPTRDAHHLFPLLCEVSNPADPNSPSNSGEAMATLQQHLLATARDLPAIYSRTQTYYAHFFDHRLTPHTPDPTLDRALGWAELAIDKAQATIPAHDGTPSETGLVAGWYPSFDSARPGFGWFFGRDTLWSTYAINSYGDPALTRRALTFLLRRQRADGKMPHEFSQTAHQLTGDMAWANLPYEYAAADSTPLFLLAMQDYLRTTNDTAFLNSNWPAIQKAYTFERTHDSDGDGVYDNAQGTGWVEGWPPKMPHQELYLAALDRDATRAFAELALLSSQSNRAELAADATATGTKIDQAVAAYRLPTGLYAFSENADHTFDPTTTIYPAVALWLHPDGLPHPETQLSAWSSHLFQTDWGTRALAETDPLYDPISYHQGTVWPLFTGWNAVAQYRNDRPLAGYAALRQNLGLTWAQDPGAVTEVLSGRFYEPLGRSSTHQLWSSAMALTPALRELFGLEPDAPRHTLTLHPHLPPTWPSATLDHVLLGSNDYTVTYRREGPSLRVTATTTTPTNLCLRNAPETSPTPTNTSSRPERSAVERPASPSARAAGASQPTCPTTPATTHTLLLPLPPLELSLDPRQAPLLPTPGAETTQPHILAETYTAHSLSLTLEAPANTPIVLHLHPNTPAAHHPHTSTGQLTSGTLTVTSPPGPGWTQTRIELSW